MKKILLFFLTQSLCCLSLGKPLDLAEILSSKEAQKQILSSLSHPEDKIYFQQLFAKNQKFQEGIALVSDGVLTLSLEDKTVHQLALVASPNFYFVYGKIVMVPEDLKAVIKISDYLLSKMTPKTETTFFKNLFLPDAHAQEEADNGRPIPNESRSKYLPLFILLTVPESGKINYLSGGKENNLYSLWDPHFQQDLRNKKVLCGKNETKIENRNSLTYSKPLNENFIIVSDGKITLKVETNATNFDTNRRVIDVSELTEIQFVKICGKKEDLSSCENLTNEKLRELVETHPILASSVNKQKKQKDLGGELLLQKLKRLTVSLSLAELCCGNKDCKNGYSTDYDIKFVPKKDRSNSAQ